VVLGVVVVGAYSIRNSMFDVWTAIVFGLVGYVMKKWGWPIAPLSWGSSWVPCWNSTSGISPRIGRISPHFHPAADLYHLYRPGVVLILMSRRLWSKVSVQEAEAGDSK